MRLKITLNIAVSFFCINRNNLKELIHGNSTDIVIGLVGVIIDNVNEMNMTPDDIRKIQERYSNPTTWQIFKATKEGDFW